MRSSSLESKTVRPGSLGAYSFYYSNRRPPQAAPAEPKKHNVKLWLLALVLLAGTAVFLMLKPTSDSSKTGSSATAVGQPAVTAANKACAGNQLSHFIKVSIGQRQLWACEGKQATYDSKVITGIEKHAATETPLGTYKIYNKQANVTLTGSDETGSWRDPVHYWMPFLDNQYGSYGFHDATWRNPAEFGKIDAATSDNASHGCVELPLAASTWLYRWAQVGTTVTIAE